METSTIVGWVLGVVGVLPLLASCTMLVTSYPVVMKNLTRFGFNVDIVRRPFAVIELTIAVLALIPSTSIFGAILATGWMGGAIATHLRVGDKFVIQAAIPILIWVGFGLRHRAWIEPLFG